MRFALPLLFLSSLSCAGPQGTSTTDVAGARHETCLSRQSLQERDQATSANCRSQHMWVGDFSDALSGAATAVRLPKP